MLQSSDFDNFQYLKIKIHFLCVEHQGHALRSFFLTNLGPKMSSLRNLYFFDLFHVRLALLFCCWYLHISGQTTYMLLYMYIHEKYNNNYPMDLELKSWLDFQFNNQQNFMSKHIPFVSTYLHRNSINFLPVSGLFSNFLPLRLDSFMLNNRNLQWIMVKQKPLIKCLMHQWLKLYAHALFAANLCY